MLSKTIPPTPAGGTAPRLWLELWRGLRAAERFRLKVAVVAMLIGSVLTALVPFFVGIFVDAVIQDGHVAGLSKAWGSLLLLAAAMSLISAMAVIQHQQVHTVTTAFTDTTRQLIYGALMRWDLARYVEGARGAIYGRANRSVEGAERLIKLGAAELLPAVFVTVFGVILAIVHFGVLGLIMALVVPTGLALVTWQIRSQNGIRVQLVRAKEAIDGDVTAWLAGLDVIRTTGTESFFTSRVGGRSVALRKIELRHHIAMSKFDAAKAINEALWFIVTLLVAIEVQATASPGDLAGIVLLYFAITKPLRELHRVIDEGSEAALQTRNLINDLAAPHDISYAAIGGSRPAVGRPRIGELEPMTVTPAIEVRNVSFTHEGADRHVLRGLSFSIPVGQRVGIVGASGCGKSTMLKLLDRLIHGYEGDIRLHGRSLQSIDRAELSTLVGYVGQRPTLFQGTVRDNLMLGRPDIVNADVYQACARANIHQDVLAMPEGYDTRIGEEGSKLSGGQSQRLCLARALVKTPHIMLLDEPTSALDGPSQAVVQHAIDELTDITMLVVAHRLSTLRTMDRILVMHHGGLVEDGTFGDLVAAGGMFADMLDSERRAA